MVCCLTGGLDASQNGLSPIAFPALRKFEVRRLRLLAQNLAWHAAWLSESIWLLGRGGANDAESFQRPQGRLRYAFVESVVVLLLLLGVGLLCQRECC